MTEGDNKPSSDDFDARLRAARNAYEARSGRSKDAGDGTQPKTGMQGIGFALRVGTELVAATGIGVAIGYGLDSWLGTGPWLLIVFLFVGGAAGVTNVYRLASGMDQGVGWRRPGDSPQDKDDGRGGKS
ncbi:MAG: AtpZ/AtpI family protein [Alphaproteobacteria bacterium]|nr:AtpZ/AtpI family protein [Alphaproteobacteria bacterium]